MKKYYKVVQVKSEVLDEKYCKYLKNAKKLKNKWEKENGCHVIIIKVSK